MQHAYGLYRGKLGVPAGRALWRDRVVLAEREGFEPSMHFLGACSLSRGVPSTTRPSLRERRKFTRLRQPGQSAYRLRNHVATGSLSSSNALCSSRTASSRYFSSMITDVLIS